MVVDLGTMEGALCQVHLVVPQGVFQLLDNISEQLHGSLHQQEFLVVEYPVLV
jgi:hypothetical protein